MLFCNVTLSPSHGPIGSMSSLDGLTKKKEWKGGWQKQYNFLLITGTRALEAWAAMWEVWLSWGYHLVRKSRGYGETACRAEWKCLQMIPASCHRVTLSLASQQWSQISWRRYKLFYCIVTQFQTHSIHEYNKMMVICYHICDGFLSRKMTGTPCLIWTSSLPWHQPVSVHAGHYSNGNCGTDLANLANTRHVDKCGRVTLQVESSTGLGG